MKVFQEQLVTLPNNNFQRNTPKNRTFTEK